MTLKTIADLKNEIHPMNCECEITNPANWARLEAAARLELGMSNASMGVK